MKTYCKEDIFNTSKHSLFEYYNLVSKKNNINEKNLNSITLIGKNSNFDSLAFVTFIMILDKELKKINFNKNLIFEIQNKNFENLSFKNLVNFIYEIQ